MVCDREKHQESHPSPASNGETLGQASIPHLLCCVVGEALSCPCAIVLHQSTGMAGCPDIWVPQARSIWWVLCRGHRTRARKLLMLSWSWRWSCRLSLSQDYPILKYYHVPVAFFFTSSRTLCLRVFQILNLYTAPSGLSSLLPWWDFQGTVPSHPQVFNFQNVAFAWKRSQMECITSSTWLRISVPPSAFHYAPFWGYKSALIVYIYIYYLSNKSSLPFYEITLLPCNS